MTDLMRHHIRWRLKRGPQSEIGNCRQTVVFVEKFVGRRAGVDVLDENPYERICEIVVAAIPDFIIERGDLGLGIEQFGVVFRVDRVVEDKPVVVSARRRCRRGRCCKRPQSEGESKTEGETSSKGAAPCILASLPPYRARRSIGNGVKRVGSPFSLAFGPKWLPRLWI